MFVSVIYCFNYVLTIICSNSFSPPLFFFVTVPHRASVDELNNKRLYALQTASETYHAKDFLMAPQFKNMLNQITVPQELTLRVGAQVILLKNLDFDQGLVNGAVGVVTDFGSKADGVRLPQVRFRNGVETLIEYAEWAFESGGQKVASRSQVPLNLAWALSIHKSQGMTLSNVEMSIEKVFAEGQAYVALSRVVSLSGLRIIGRLPPFSAMKPNVRVINFYRSFS